MKSIIFIILILGSSFSYSQNLPKNENHFKVGDLAPEFTDLDQNQVKIESKEIIKTEKIVLIFYRGSWCPYCIKHMKVVQDKLDQIEKYNARVIMVTSEAPFSVEKTIAKTKASFSIISDTNNVILKSYGVYYVADETTVPSYTDIVIKKTKESNNDEVPILPITSAYVIGKDHKIEWMFFDNDYKNRADIDEIIEFLGK